MQLLFLKFDENISDVSGLVYSSSELRISSVEASFLDTIITLFMIHYVILLKGKSIKVMYDGMTSWRLYAIQYGYCLVYINSPFSLLQNLFCNIIILGVNRGFVDNSKEKFKKSFTPHRQRVVMAFNIKMSIMSRITKIGHDFLGHCPR